jgi:hypothetical protein
MWQPVLPFISFVKLNAALLPKLMFISYGVRYGSNGSPGAASDLCGQVLAEDRHLYAI